ncbi:hypothetical protein MNBD_UNCLBAC01-1476 [hydrothermal vent metagenome]|uniref:Phage-related protein n=1 Tax=hydrothermal vent metagenome TaxID=652676 RepID=A0A3B1E039_9ZZZZ
MTSSDRSPVEEFLDDLDMRTQRKFLYVRLLLEEFGIKLSMPFCKYLKNDIYELRFKGKEGDVRVLYFFIKDKRIIFTNGFLKKTQKAPVKEIQLAIKRKQVFKEGKYHD